MAQKRMFDKSIIDTRNFLYVPLTAKAAYFLLGMEADDEGFVDPERVKRLYGIEPGDIKILSDAGLIIPFNSGVVVITHWKQNNWLDSRRIKPTQYIEERQTLIESADGKYMLSNGLASATLEEYRGEEYRGVENSNTRISSKAKRLNGEYEESFETFWEIYPEKKGKGKAYETWILLNSDTKMKCIQAIKTQVENNHFWKPWANNGKGADNAPHPTTWLNQSRWDDSIIFIERTGDNLKATTPTIKVDRI